MGERWRSGGLPILTTARKPCKGDHIQISFRGLTGVPNKHTITIARNKKLYSRTQSRGYKSLQAHQSEIEALKPKLIVAVGNEALKFLSKFDSD